MGQGLNKFTEKERRKQRRQYEHNHIAQDLDTPKYRQRVIPNRKRIDNDDGSFYLADRYYEEEIESHEQ